MIFFLFSSFFPPSARSIIVHFRFASFSIRAPVSATWPNNASQRKIERARGTKISVHRGSRVRDARPTLGATGGGGRGKVALSLKHLGAEKKRGSSSRQVNLPRASFNPLPPRQAEEKKSTRLPLGVRTVTSAALFATSFRNDFFLSSSFLKFHEGKIQ